VVAVTEIVYSRGGTPDNTLFSAPQPEITLYDMAEILMNRIRQAFAQRGIVLPTRQIIYLSPIPVDCEQLGVLISGWVPLPSWEGLTGCQLIKWCGAFTIVVSRASPAMPKGTRSAPSAESMNAAARMGSEDAEALLTVVNGLGEVGPEFALELGAPEGGFQTVACTIQVPAFGGLE
jgi:hypothetical protein